MHSTDFPAAILRPLLDYVEEGEQIGVWLCELSNSSVYWSGRLFALLGLDAAKVQPSLSIYQSILHPDDRAEFSEKQPVELGGPLGDREFRIIRPNGIIRWIRSRGQVLYRPDGTPWRAIGYACDITDERDARAGAAALEGARQSLRKLAGGEIWVSTASAAGSVESNPWSVTTTWHERLPGGNLHEEDLTRVGAAWAKALAERRPFRSSYRMDTGQGRFETFVSHGEPVEDERRRPMGWVGVTLPDDLPYAEAAPAKNIPGPLLRAARGWLNLSVLDLADRCGLSSSTIRRLEGDGGRQATRDSEEVLLRTFHEAGIDFYVDGGGYPQVRFGSKRPAD